MKKIYVIPTTEQYVVKLNTLMGASDLALDSVEEASTTGTGDNVEYENSLSRTTIWDEE